MTRRPQGQRRGVRGDRHRDADRLDVREALADRRPVRECSRGAIWPGAHCSAPLQHADLVPHLALRRLVHRLGEPLRRDADLQARIRDRGRRATLRRTRGPAEGRGRRTSRGRCGRGARAARSKRSSTSLDAHDCSAPSPRWTMMSPNMSCSLATKPRRQKTSRRRFDGRCAMSCQMFTNWARSPLANSSSTAT